MDGLPDLVRLLEDVAPTVWNAALRQVKIEAGCYLAILVLLCIVTLVVIVFEVRVGLEGETEIALLLFVVSALAITACIALYAQVRGMYVNPELFAIQKLLH